MADDAADWAGRENAQAAVQGTNKRKRGKATGKGLGKTEPKRSDGRFFKARNGVEICFKWARAEGGCAEPCPDRRMHVCEWCRQPHRSVKCPTQTRAGPPTK